MAEHHPARGTGSPKSLTRRRFLVLGATALAGMSALLTACQPAAAPAPTAEKKEAAPAATKQEAPAATKAPEKAAETKAPAQSKGEKIVLKFGHVIATTEPIHIRALEWAKRVNEKTNGQVEIQVYPNSTLGNNRDTYEQTLSGAPVIAHADPGYMSDYVPDFGVLQGPFLVEGPDEFDKIFASPFWADLTKRLLDKGLETLSFNWYFGQRHVISDQPRPDPASLKGVKFRVPPNIMWQKTIAAMGATPTPLEWSEVYSGLAQGVVNAAEAPLSTLYGSKLYEVANTITLTGHFKALTGVVAGKYYQGLPADIKKIIADECAQSGKDATADAVNLENDWKKKLEGEGTKFVAADIPAFKKATAVVYTQFPDWTPGLYDQVQKILAS